MDVERTHWYPASPAEVWSALTDPDALAEWFGERAVVIDRVEPRRCIAWTWEGRGDEPSSSVTIQLEPDSDGTTVTVVERAVVSVRAVPIGFRPPTDRGEPRALARV